MHISKFAIENYKSYLEPQEVQLSPGFNVIIGPNNAGKSAMIEALSLRFESKPHRSLETIPSPGGSPIGISKIHITFEISQDEFRALVFEKWRAFNIRKSPQERTENLTNRVFRVFSLPAIYIDGIYQPNEFILARIVEMNEPESVEMWGQFTLESIDSLPTLKHLNIGNNDALILTRNMVNTFHQRIYHFRAERFNIGQHQIGTDPVLKPDASKIVQG